MFYGHYWSQGASIVDVTDPAKPEVVAFIPNRDEYGHSTKVLVNHKNIMMLPIGTLTELDKGQAEADQRARGQFLRRERPEAPEVPFLVQDRAGNPDQQGRAL